MHAIYYIVVWFSIMKASNSSTPEEATWTELKSNQRIAAFVHIGKGYETTGFIHAHTL